MNNRNRLSTFSENNSEKIPGKSVEETAGQWLENSRLRLKESSYVKYRNILKNHILPELGQTELRQLTTDHVSAFIRQKLTEGRRDGKGGLSVRTVRDILSVLRNTCSYAKQHDIDVPCHFELLKFRRSEEETRVLDRRESAVLERFLMKDDNPVKTGILMSMYMGLRLGEVCALKKESILYKEEILQIRFTMQRIQAPDREEKRTKIIVTEPKTGNAIRDIPIPAPMLGRLWTLDHMPGEAYILTGRPDKFIEPRSLENIFKRYLRECGLPEINYHALRHTFATRCIESGFDVKSLSEILGHGCVNITLNRYVHSSIEQKRKNMGKLHLT